jgi:hypothetical protein
MASPKGRRWEAYARSVIAYYAGICHICNHAGARQVDHLVPVTEDPAKSWDPRNCRPAHGVSRRPNPCPVCSIAAGQPIYCNQIRGMGSVERAQRIIAERIAASTASKPLRSTPPDAGRAW